MHSNNFLYKLRTFFWPVQKEENRMFIPMALMMLFILLNYAILRSVKDGLIVNSIGPEAISFLKLYVVLPLAFVSILVYTKLCNIMNHNKVFYTIGSFFLLYFVVFTFLIYPKIHAMHFNKSSIEFWVKKYPYLQWFIKIIGHWGYSLLYAFSELWGSIMLSLLFWQFANRVTTTTQAKRFYSMFGLIGNIGPLFLPLILSFLDDSVTIVPKNVKYLPVFCCVILINILVLVLYRYLTYYLKVVDLDLENSKKTTKKKLKLSIKDSLKLILTSRYLGMMVILVISYGVSINLVEGIWKANLRKIYTTETSYTQFMGKFQAIQSMVSIAFMIIGSYILRNVSWKVAAMLTPMVILCTGGIFLSLVIFKDFVGIYLAQVFGISTLSLALFFGNLQIILSKSTKYSLFDSTKEMAYIPLSPELKSKGKAAVDVLGGRLGKSGGGLIQSTFFIAFPNLYFEDAIPFFGIIFLIILVMWLFVIDSINIEYQKKLK